MLRDGALEGELRFEKTRHFPSFAQSRLFSAQTVACFAERTRNWRSHVASRVASHLGSD